MPKEENFITSLSVAGIVIVISILLFAGINYFVDNFFISSVASMFIVMFGIFYFVGRQMIEGILLAIVAAAIIIGLLTNSIAAIAMAVTGLCLLIIGALLLKA